MTDASFDIFQYTDAHEALHGILDFKQKKNYRFSIRAWSKQIGFKNPSYLSDLLNRKRNITLQAAERILSSTTLTPSERAYFRGLVLQTKVAGSKTNEFVLRYLLEAKQANVEHQLDLETFALISDWHHIAILETIGIDHAGCELKDIAARLFYKLSDQCISESVSLLERLNLIERSSTGLYKKKRPLEDLLVCKNISSHAIRDHHKQILKLATESIDTQPIEARDVSSSFIAIKKADLEKVRNLIYKFHSDLRKICVHASNSDVYCIAVQAFNISSKRGDQTK